MNLGRILLVEDNTDDVVLTRRAFKKAQLANEIVVARDGVEALEMLFPEEHGTDNAPLNPAMILLDINLPRINGLEVLQQIRQHERTQFIPIIVLTTSDEQRDLVTSYKLGANSYIRKPVDFMKFARAVKQLGFYWLVLNEHPQPKQQ